MNLELNGKKALVTASTVGIGFATAKRLHQEGASVIVNGRTEGRVFEAVRKLEADGVGTVRGIVADLATAEGARKLFEAVPVVDILVNNLGSYEAKALDEITDNDWTRMFETNVLSGARLSQYYLKRMKDLGWGRIIFIASESGVNIPPDMIHYGVSKAAQIALARGMAETTAGTKVTINTVLPGPTYSEGVDSFLESVVKGKDRKQAEREFITGARPTSLIQRFASADEVASLIAYLASPLASATTGAALRVEGGLLRGTL